MQRRRFLSACAAASVSASLKFPSHARAHDALGLHLGTPEEFSFARLCDQARARARQPYRKPSPTAPESTLQEIDYDAYQKIQYRPERELWHRDRNRFPVRLFHLGRAFQLPVQVHIVAHGRARAVTYSSELFEYGDAGLARRLPPNLGFAGFRVMNGGGDERDWLAFAGASYFRSSGALDQYGLSARGIAIDTAMPHPEEFPRFTSYWIDQSRGNQHIVVYALLDGPSVTGAYRFDCSRRRGPTMDVKARVFVRKNVSRLGIAPLTSMFWFAENNRHQATDWRPEVHDSDGLAIWNGRDERLWRPLNNPGGVRTSTFEDEHPKGFGLMQRDRNFQNYEDDGVFYDRRPSVWVEPRGKWGAGAVQLVEIPTDDEVFDNIVAYWVPKRAASAKSEFRFDYRLHWKRHAPFMPRSLARVWHTRIGRGGVPGQPRPKGVIKFAIDFGGGALAKLDTSKHVRPVVTTSRGRIINPYALKVVGTKKWRAVFDLRAPGSEPAELRCFLQRGRETMSETWLYQHLPFEFDPSSG